MAFMTRGTLSHGNHAFNSAQLRERYVWTSHARMKMRHYRLTEARIKRIIRYPARVEEGIFPGAIACMSPADGRPYSEIWTFYTLASIGKREGGIMRSASRTIGSGKEKKIKVISAWRYPGKSPARDPIPQDVLREIRGLV